MFLDDLKEDLQNFTLREQQKDSLLYIKKCIKISDKKFVLMNLPMGVGKSLLAIKTGQYFYKETEKYVDIITAGKPLQDQYSNTFKSIANLKGKANYYCAEFETTCDRGQELCKLNKMECEVCPYAEAKGKYLTTPISLTNFHLYLTNTVYKLPFFNDRYKDESDILIVDEAHLLDDTISSFFQVKLSRKILEKMGVPNYEQYLSILNNVTTTHEYISLVESIKKEIINLLNNTVHDDMEVRSLAYATIEKAHGYQRGKLKRNSEEFGQILSDYSTIASKFLVFLTEFNVNPENWVIEFNEEEDGTRGVVVEPVWVGEYLEKYIWSKYSKVVLMSATFLNKELTCEVNGIDIDDANYYSIPIPFLPKNRKIYYVPVGKMTYNYKVNTFKYYKKMIPKILKKYPNKKGIIHTNSFELAGWISDGISSNRFITHDSATREEALKHFFESNDDNVFVSPSVSTGVSFDDDLARFQIIAKIPYPNIASKKNKKRLEQNKEWYNLVTVQHLVQTCGRIVRSMEDFGDTFILDSSFSDIMNFSSKYIPEWLLSNVIYLDVPKDIFVE